MGYGSHIKKKKQRWIDIYICTYVMLEEASGSILVSNILKCRYSQELRQTSRSFYAVIVAAKKKRHPMQ